MQHISSTSSLVNTTPPPAFTAAGRRRARRHFHSPGVMIGQGDYAREVRVQPRITPFDVGCTLLVITIIAAALAAVM